MSRQFFIQFKRHFPFLEVYIILMYNPALRLNLADSGKGRASIAAFSQLFTRPTWTTNSLAISLAVWFPLIAANACNLSL